MRLRALSTSVTMGLAVLVALPAPAAEGRRPIWFSGQVITTPGKYFVSRNLPTSAAGPVIIVAAPRVDLDLNGMEIDQSGNPGDPAILVAGAVTEVRIHNGAIFGGLHSIRTDPGRKVVIEGVRTLGSTTESILLEDVDSQVIRNNVILDCVDGAGVRLVGGALKNGTVEHNTIRFCNGGIQVENGSAMTIRLNRIEDSNLGAGPSAAGILLIGSRGLLLTENVIERVEDDGIRLEESSGNKLYNNVVHQVVDAGIFLAPGPAGGSSNDNLIRTNVVTEAGFGGGGSPGILVFGDRNYIEDNVANSNGSYGIVLGAGTGGNVVKENQIQGNGGPPLPVCVDFFAPPDLCSNGGNITPGDNFCGGGPC